MAEPESQTARKTTIKTDGAWIEDRVHRIALPTPFPVGSINCYLIEGESPTLIDPGLRSQEAIQTLAARLEERGLALSNIRSIILTHYHLDHAGGARRLQEISGASVRVHRLDAERLVNGLLHPAVGEALAEAGLGEEEQRALASRYREFDPFREPVDVMEPLEEGEILPTGAGKLTVIHTPGHTRGSLCLLAEDGTVFSGDTLLERITPNPVLDGDGNERFKALPAHVRSLEKLSELRPGRILPGHGEPFEGLAPLVEKTFSLYRERGERILKLLREATATVAEIGERLFGQSDPSGIFLAISEAYGHLDLLEAHGLVEVAATHPLRYRARAGLSPSYPRFARPAD